MSISDKLSKIADNQKKLYEAGYEKGKAEGGDSGSYDEGYNAGQKAEYDRFWDVYQNNGNPKQYFFAFAGYGWTDETFKPKYDIIFAQASNLNAFQYSKMTNIVESLKTCGVTLDTSLATNLQSAFAYAETRALPVLDTTSTSHISSIFESCKKLECIEKLIVKAATQYNNAFKNCEALKDIIFEGEIGNDIDFQYSTFLSKESIENIISCLSDTVTGKTLTLSQTAVESAFPTEEEEVSVYPFANFPSDVEGLTFTDNGDGSITANGVCEASTYCELVSLSVSKGTYSFICTTTGSCTQDHAYPLMAYYGTDNLDVYTGPMELDTEYTLTFPEDGTISLEYEVFSGVTYDNFTVKPTLKKKANSEWEALIAPKVGTEDDPKWIITRI